MDFGFEAYQRVQDIRMPDDPWVAAAPNADSSAQVGENFPYQIFVDNEEAYHVRAGGFFGRNKDGDIEFAGTDASVSQGTFDINNITDDIGVGDEVWANLDMTGSAWDVTFSTAAVVPEDATPDQYMNVMVGKITADGEIRQHVFGHISVGGGTGESLGHSFKPTLLTDTTASITPGYVVYRDGTKELISPSNITFSTNDKFWMTLDYTSASPAAQLNGGTSWPLYIDGTYDKIHIPVMEFVDNEWAGLIRHQTNDILTKEGEIEIRGTKGLFKVSTLRAYLTLDDSLVDATDPFNAETMYLFPTWDWVRWA